LAGAGFVIDTVDQQVLRREAGLDVQGWLVDARRDAGAMDRRIHAV
jgi:hypothetical protein